MPTYDYTCQACGKHLELFQSMSERPKRKCPACGALKLKRHIGTGAGFVFKGSGFYLTDYRSDSYKADEKQAKGESASGAGDSAGSKEKAKGQGASKSKDTKPAKEKASKKKGPSD